MPLVEREDKSHSTDVFERTFLLLRGTMSDDEQRRTTLDYECLQKYSENNLQFSMGLILEKKDGEDERFIGYTCLYRSDEHRLKLHFDIDTATWKTNAEDFYPEDEQQMLHLLFDDLNHIRCLTLDQQIQLIIHRFEQYFAGQ